MTTAKNIIAELEKLGFEVFVDGDDIVLRADEYPAPDIYQPLVAELKVCKKQAIEYLRGWQGEMKELVDWFLTDASLPETPFNLNPWTRVVDPSKFYAGLREDINVGPKRSRGRTGGLECDLIDLQKRTLH